MGEWLHGEVALVTGGGSGLGRAIVERFLLEGASVGVLERSAEKAARLESELGDRVRCVTGDVRSLDDNRRAVAETVAAFGKLDVFVGNAGIWDGNVPLLALPEEALDACFDEVIGVNVKGCLVGAYAAAAELQRSSGAIVFTVSNAGFYPNGGGPIYTASKHAVVGLVRELAFELAPAVRVNGVAPGAVVDTDLRGPVGLGMDGLAVWSMFTGEQVEEMAAVLPLQRFGKSEDYTGAYTFLASRQNSSNMTGVVINCDGGIGVRGFR